MRKNFLTEALTCAALLSAVATSAHAESVFMKGDVTVETPKCDIIINPVGANVDAMLQFTQAALTNGTAGQLTASNAAAEYQIKLDGGQGCKFGNLAIKMPYVNNASAGTNGNVPLLRTSFGELPGYPVLASMNGFTSHDNTGTPVLLSGAIHSPVPFSVTTGTPNAALRSNSGWAGSPGLFNAATNVEFAGFSGKQYTPTLTLSYDEAAVTTAIGGETWPRTGGTNRPAGAPDLRGSFGGGPEANYINVPAASLSNYGSMTIKIGMLYGLQTYDNGVVNNNTAIQGDTFLGTGTLEVTVS